VIKKLFTVRSLLILLAVIALFVVSGLLGLEVVLPEVSLAAEPIFYIGSFGVTNSLLTSWLLMILLIVVAILATRRAPKNLESASNQSLVPQSGLQNALEMVVEGFYGLARNIGGSWAPKFFPIIMTMFLFVIVANFSGLIPGFGSIGLLEPAHGAQAGHVVEGVFLTGAKAGVGEEGYVLVPFFRAPSTDLNFPLALALVTVVLSQYFGLRALKFGYVKKFINFSGFKKGVLVGGAQLLAGLLEIVSEFAKIISLTFRLFGNILAGEVLLAVLAFLIPYLISVPFYGLEVFVGFVQALVFFMLTLVFFSLAVTGHGDEAHH
jgi:F-type H+-transporting ATPase subunit a